MAKRVFELAKELGVKSKAILEKCEAEGIPNMNNHMSSISAGLEATVREWFSDSGGGTAVETAEHVDLDKVRVKPRPTRAKAKRAAPRKAAEPVEAETTEEAPARAPEPMTPAAPAPAAPEPARPAPQREVAEPVARGPEEVEEAAPARPDRREPEEGQRAAAKRREPGEDDDRPESPGRGEAPGAPVEEPEGEPVMNVPTRPKSVAPAGPKLEAQKPAKLSGPRVVRVEAPDVVQSPRSRGGGGGGVARGGPGFDPREPGAIDDEGGGRSSRRNKRRGGPGQGGGGSGGGGGGSGVRRTRGDDRGDAGSWRKQDLIEREARLSRSGGFLRQRRREMKKREQTPSGERAAMPAEVGGQVKIAAPFTIKDLSSATGVKASAIIKKLFLEGIAATVNSGIDSEKAQEIMLDHDIELVVEAAKSAEDVVQEQFTERTVVDERPRSPVVTILGHVDHGKTSLLDRIRKTNVASGEAGGITQATSAFRVPVHAGDQEKHVLFIDTPGHEAFTAMRSRGATMTDLVVLVVAADDGVMPQTIESINHAKAAGVPIVVALNKIDKPEATDTKIQQIFGQLAEHGLNPADWGGETEVVRTSATSGKGIEDLLEVLDYQAQLLELKADFGGPARGVVVESRFMEGRGPVANLLVEEGKLAVGDFIVAGRAYGRVRDIVDDRGNRIKEAEPSTPVQISGIDELPAAGDKFFVVESLKQAQDAAEQRRERERERELAQPKVTLETMFSKMEAGKVAELLVVIKADVQGS
ncbi:MAG: translation initiation factor IF-2, partial [Planctomycetota bacterium]|nr:translation initiation factor IF-2 [Planctomycetota bacterium]